MKRFEFSPERVRLWRARQAELEELKLQQLRSELQHLILQQQAIESEARRSRETVLDSTKILAEDLANLDSFKQFARSQSLQLEAKKRQCEGRVAQQQKMVVTARRAAELLNQLKSKSLAAWKASYNKEQENLSSELFLARRNRQR